jgi:hypothetical protein
VNASFFACVDQVKADTRQPGLLRQMMAYYEIKDTDCKTQTDPRTTPLQITTCKQPAALEYVAVEVKGLKCCLRALGLHIFGCNACKISADVSITFAIIHLHTH